MIQDAGTVPVTHFTCIGNTREGIKDQLQNYLDNGVDHMLALRGDLPLDGQEQAEISNMRQIW